MKKKLLLTLSLAFVLACFFAISVFAEVVISENNIDEDGDIVADVVCRVESVDEQHICSIDVTYETANGETKESKIYYFVGLWAQQNKRQIEIIYVPSDFEMSQTIYFFDKVDVDGDGQYAANELIKGTKGGGFCIKSYTAYENDTFENTVDVKNTEVQAISYSKYLTYFGGNTFSDCSVLTSVTYNGRELEDYACIISPSVEVIMGGTFGGNGVSLDKNTSSPNFTRLVFEDRTGSVSFDQYCFTRGELREIVFGSGRYALNGSDRIALLYNGEGSSEYCLERVVVSKDTVIASGSISWNVGEYDVIVLGLESECASTYEANCSGALKNARSVTYNPCYFGHSQPQDDFNCETALVCPACLTYEYVASMTHVLDKGIELSDLFAGGCTFVGCINEGCLVREETAFDAIFVWMGYSVSTYGNGLSIVQGYAINRDSFNVALDNLDGFEIGVFATVNKTGKEMSPTLGDENVIFAPLGSVVNNYIDIKLIGIPTGEADTDFVCCIYAKLNGVLYFLDGGVSSMSIVGISPNEIGSIG